MARKVFVSYKYGDGQVKPLAKSPEALLAQSLFNNQTTARHYVDELQDLIDENDHIFKGEDDGEDLSTFKDDTIETKLKQKIRDSTVTIILISKGMKTNEPETEQWVPWEVSYSLKEISSARKTSNGLLAVILPDQSGSYSYYLDECVHCNIKTHKTSTLFQILGSNMFNQKEKIQYDSNCNIQNHGKVHKDKFHSYAHQIKWDDFIKNIDYYIDHAIELRNRINDYNIQKVVLKTSLLNN